MMKQNWLWRSLICKPNGHKKKTTLSLLAKAPPQEPDKKGLCVSEANRLINCYYRVSLPRLEKHAEKVDEIFFHFYAQS